MNRENRPGNNITNSLLIFLLLLFIISFFGCFNDNIDKTIDDDFKKAQDTAGIGKPVPGNGGIINTSSITGNSVYLTWATGSDDNTSAADLLYIVYKSTSNNIKTVTEAETNGTAVTGWIKSLNFATINGLMNGKSYFFNILLKDTSSKKSSYSTVSVSTDGVIYLLTAGKYRGNLSSSPATARQEIDDEASMKKSIDYPGLSCSSVRGFISTSASDSIVNLPGSYNVPTDWEIVGPGGVVIAYNWNDLMDGSINSRLDDAGVMSGHWWSGSLNNGSFDSVNNCSGWTDGTIFEDGRDGTHNFTDSKWMTFGTTNCNTQRELLYVCW